MESLQALLNTEYLHNSLRVYVQSAVTLVGLILVFMLGKQILVRRLRKLAKKTANDLDDLIVDLLAHIGPPVFIVISIYVATLSLDLNKSIQSIIYYAMVIVLTIRFVILMQSIVTYGVAKAYRRARPDDPGTETAVQNISFVLRWALWALGSVFILDNLGINISALVAGLGIGGIAVAMASQAVLGDAFSALSIFVDKPFQVGDFIIVGDLLGTVEQVGIKTTRIRSLHGEQLIFANSDLTASRIRNYKRMQTRRIAFSIGVTYQTTYDQTVKIPKLVHDLCGQIEGIQLDRVHFKSFGDFALIYEIVYYVLSPDYNIYMDKQQEINFALKKVFEREKIDFAYPTQTLFLMHENNKS